MRVFRTILLSKLMYFRSRQTIKRKKDYLIKKGLPFTLVETSSSIRLKDPKGASYFNTSGPAISPKYLHLFRAIKNEILSNLDILELPFYDVSDAKYFEFGPDLYEGLAIKVDFPVIEYDINKAYYQAARNLGYISNEFYNSCLDLPKEVRLILIGSIAARKLVTEFDGEKFKKRFVYNSYLRRVWFHLVNEVDNCLTELMNLNPDEFLFYWVDGIYFYDLPRVRNSVNLISQKFNFEFSEKRIEKVSIGNLNGEKVVYIWKNGEKFEFNLPRNKRVKFNPQRFDK